MLGLGPLGGPGPRLTKEGLGSLALLLALMDERLCWALRPHGPRPSAVAKAQRPQIARAPSWDWKASFVINLLASWTGRECLLSDVATYRQWAALFTVAAERLNLPVIFTPHCVRAGWASWRHSLATLGA